MSALLRVRDLRKEFPLFSPLLKRRIGAVVAVDGVDLIVESGEVVALVGESGSGKTTLGRLILRLLEPTAGTVEFCGRELSALSAEAMRRQRRRMQMVFQDPYASLNPRMRVRDALFEPLRVHRLASSESRGRIVERLLVEVGLPADTASRYPHELSGGQRQRIGIARALATSPELLIADEPVSALDVSIRAQVLNLLLEVRARRRLAILLIVHDLSLVERIADRLVVLYLGRVVEEGPASAVAHDPWHPYTGALLSAARGHGAGGPEAPIAIVGEPPSRVRPPSGCRYHPRCPIADGRCRQETPRPTPPADGRSVACHRPRGWLSGQGPQGMEPFVSTDVKKTDAGHGATQ